MKVLFLLFVSLSLYGAADEPELHLTENDHTVARGMVTIANTFFQLVEEKNKELKPEQPVAGMPIMSYWANDLRTADIDPNEHLGITQGLLMRDTTLYCRFGAWCFAKDRMVTGLMRQAVQNSNEYWVPLFSQLCRHMKSEIRSVDDKEYAVVNEVGNLSMPELIIEKKAPKASDEKEAASSSTQTEEQPKEKKKIREHFQEFVADFTSAFMSIGDWAQVRQKADEPHAELIEIKRLNGKRLSAEGVLEPLQPEPELTFEQKERIACWRKIYKEAVRKQAHRKEV